jgi:cyclic pyranopterin phosphate synthase
MPIEGVKLTPKQNLMTLEERKRLINIFCALGVNKLRFTGGEPTISNQLIELIKHSRDIKTVESIGITTNGLILTNMLDNLKDAGVTSINISLDTLNEKKFANITRRDGKSVYRVLSSIYATISKNIPLKINCVLIRGVNDDEILDFVELTRENRVDCRFIELMPFDGNDWNPKKFISFYEVIDRLKNFHVRCKFKFYL